MWCCSCWLQHPLKAAQGGDQEGDSLGSGKIDRTGLRIAKELILWEQFSDLLISRKAPESFMVTTAPCDKQKPSRKICAWLHVPLLQQNHKYTDLPPTYLEQFLRAIWGAASRDIVLTLPQIKLNWQLSSCTSFFNWHREPLFQDGTHNELWR